uniref:Putative S locus-related glycoprotein 1 binding pollen coat protein (SLR1-BP) n=1 Tax=Davidia involucrata TaxID=16924 RepID=A0A5B7BLD2_DAVIN
MRGKVEAMDNCSAYLGSAEDPFCRERCKAEYGGSITGNTTLCECSYQCGTGPHPHTCTNIVNLPLNHPCSVVGCDGACQQYGGLGICNPPPGFNFCVCKYEC